MINRLYNNFDVEIILGSRVAMKVLLGVLVVELQAGKLRMVTTVFMPVLFTNVPTGHAVSDPGLGQQQQQRR